MRPSPSGRIATYDLQSSVLALQLRSAEEGDGKRMLQLARVESALREFAMRLYQEGRSVLGTLGEEVHWFNVQDLADDVAWVLHSGLALPRSQRIILKACAAVRHLMQALEDDRTPQEAPQPEDEEHVYYVSAVDADGWYPLLGPFTRHEDALPWVDRVMGMVLKIAGSTALGKAYGTCRARKGEVSAPKLTQEAVIAWEEEQMQILQTRRKSA